MRITRNKLDRNSVRTESRWRASPETDALNGAFNPAGEMDRGA